MTAPSASGIRLPALKHTLTDHSCDSVYAVAFGPDGTLLASAGADRSVKIWDVATGKRLYSLNEATDWLYAVPGIRTARTWPRPASTRAFASGRCQEPAAN